MIIWTISILEDNMTQQIILYPSYPPVIESFKVRYNNNILLYMKKRHLDFCYLCPRERRFSMSRFTRTKHNTNTLLFLLQRQASDDAWIQILTLFLLQYLSNGWILIYIIPPHSDSKVA